MTYFDALKRTGKILDAFFEQSKDVFHNASKGVIREAILSKVIRPYLPNYYGLSSGEAFDENGNISNQLDIVVYNSMFSYVIPYNDTFIQFPCESIYGNIEVKSLLNSCEFNAAIKNISSLKRLQRESTHSWTVTPQVQISINGLPHDTGRNPYFGIIFAYDSVNIDTVLDYLIEAAESHTSNQMPNLIVLYSKKAIIVNANDEQLEAYQKDNFNKYTVLDCGNDILAAFIGILINYTRFSLLKMSDIPKQTNAMMTEILNRQIGRTKEIWLVNNKGT